MPSDPNRLPDLSDLFRRWLTEAGENPTICASTAASAVVEFGRQMRARQRGVR
jgi:hypothetical protein